MIPQDKIDKKFEPTRYDKENPIWDIKPEFAEYEKSHFVCKPCGGNTFYVQMRSNNPWSCSVVLICASCKKTEKEMEFT